MPYDPPGWCEEVVMRAVRLVVLMLIIGAAAAFLARLLRPVPVLRDVESDADTVGIAGYVGPTPAEGAEVSVADAIPLGSADAGHLGVPGQRRAAADEATQVS
jgi:hypothetical protein